MKFPKTFRGRLLFILLAFNIALLSVSIIYGHITASAMSSEKEAVECVFKNNFFAYCPGCGGSRSLVYLLRLDLLKSFYYFPALPLAALFVLDVDIRAVISLIKNSPATLYTFKAKYLLILPIIIILTFLIRNLLLFGFGIDPLGDIRAMISG